MHVADVCAQYITQINSLDPTHDVHHPLGRKGTATLGNIRPQNPTEALIDIVWRETLASISSQCASKPVDERLYIDKWIKLHNLTGETGHPWQSLCCV